MLANATAVLPESCRDSGRACFCDLVGLLF